MEAKFKVGEMVAERIRPAQKLIVKRQAYNVYYCKITEDLSRKELVFHERELQAYEALPLKQPVPLPAFSSAMQTPKNTM